MLIRLSLLVNKILIHFMWKKDMNGVIISIPLE